LVVLTHPEADHITGLVEVLQRYKVEQVLEYDGQQIEGFHSLAYDEWLKLIEQKDIKRTIAQAGQQIELGDGIRIEVLHPPEELLEGTDSDTNNNSVVLRLEWNEVSFLLTGDIEEEAEREILHQGYKLNSTVLKVGHHGSSTSTSEQFLSAVDPEIAVISVGENNPFGHPSDEVVNRLKEKLGKDNVYLTSEHGTITFTTDGEKLWVKTER
jgi:competence protein ComEC